LLEQLLRRQHQRDEAKIPHELTWHVGRGVDKELREGHEPLRGGARCSAPVAVASSAAQVDARSCRDNLAQDMPA
jgi:hypothetical protein